MNVIAKKMKPPPSGSSCEIGLDENGRRVIVCSGGNKSANKKGCLIFDGFGDGKCKKEGPIFLVINGEKVEFYGNPRSGYYYKI